MKYSFNVLYFLLFSLSLYGQDCTILSKANTIVPDKLCSPVSATWQVSYKGVNNAGAAVQIQFDWDDGNSEKVAAITTGPGSFQATASHSYLSSGDKCNYRPKATLVVNGVVCTSSTQQQIVTVWDNDDHNGGKLHINPQVYPICLGNSANARFQDMTQFNCVPPQENDVPNLYTRWVQWIYGTDITMTGSPVTIDGNLRNFPYSGPVNTLTGPVTGSGIYSALINVAGDKLTGQYFQVTLRNWNYCNPYDDPGLPGPPKDTINGDHPPVVTTAIVLIVPYPDATIVPIDTLCLENSIVTLRAHDPGGTWSGDGVLNDGFNPSVAGVGNHIVKYRITDTNKCTAEDQITVIVMPPPEAKISRVSELLANGPPVSLTAAPPGGIFSGTGVSGDKFDPSSAGPGSHLIRYQTAPDRFGCTGTDTIHIRVVMPPLPNALFISDTLGCSPLNVQFINQSTAGESYLWDFGDKTFSSLQSPSHIYHLPGEYIVQLTVTNYSGQSTFKRLIRVFQNPSAIFSVFPTEVINNSQVVVLTNFSTYATSYLWDFGDHNTSAEENPWHKYEFEGTYTVRLTVRSADGCLDSMRYKYPVQVDFKTGEIRFPNAFIWNQSGPTGGYWGESQLNDQIFRPFFLNVTDYRLQIFNRWGILIYESTDLYKGWDGYFSNGRLANQGVYVWKVTGQYADGSYFTKAGDVTFLH
jgi:PKD repeat protein